MGIVLKSLEVKRRWDKAGKWVSGNLSTDWRVADRCAQHCRSPR